MTIWRKHGGPGLGDVWALTQWCLRESERTGEPTRLCPTFPTPEDPGVAVVRDLVPRVAALLDSPGSIEVIDAPWRACTLIPDRDLFGPHLPAPLRMRHRAHRWDGGSAGTVTYQFDGRSSAELKNPPAADIPRLLAAIGPARAVRLGRPLAVEAIVAALASCRLHVGVCSGIMHVAHSVRCPRLLIEYGLHPHQWHPAAGWHCAVGTAEAIADIADLAP